MTGEQYLPTVNVNGVINVSSTAVTLNTTSTAFMYTTAASTILAADPGRNYAILRNMTGTHAHLGFGMMPTWDTYSLSLNQFDAYEINNTNLFRGTINVIGQGAGTISVTSW